MIDFTVASTTLLVWGIVAHLIADWLLQNDWMSANKSRRRQRGSVVVIDRLKNPQRMRGGLVAEVAEKHDEPVEGPWWDRHPAAYVHAGIHLAVLALVFPLAAAAALGLAHLLIDLRTPVAWWSKLIRQTQPGKPVLIRPSEGPSVRFVPWFDIGTEVRIWTDQVFHVACIAIAAGVCG